MNARSRALRGVGCRIRPRRAEPGRAPRVRGAPAGLRRVPSRHRRARADDRAALAGDARGGRSDRCRRTGRGRDPAPPRSCRSRVSGRVVAVASASIAVVAAAVLVIAAVAVPFAVVVVRPTGGASRSRSERRRDPARGERRADVGRLGHAHRDRLPLPAAPGADPDASWPLRPRRRGRGRTTSEVSSWRAVPGSTARLSRRDSARCRRDRRVEIRSMSGTVLMSYELAAQ